MIKSAQLLNNGILFLILAAIVTIALLFVLNLLEYYFAYKPNGGFLVYFIICAILEIICEYVLKVLINLLIAVLNVRLIA